MKNLRLLFAFAVLSLALTSCKSEKTLIPEDCTGVHWSHHSSEDGQDKWPELCSGYSACGGQSQSPVNIAGFVTDTSLADLVFSYATTPADIENNGHTIEFACEQGSTLTIGSQQYNLLQFHYHAKSEHQVNGINYPLEVHFVHQASETDFAVVGVFFEAGEANELFSEFLTHFPTEKGTYADTTEIELANLLPESKSFCHYSGSLTTPPCSEVVSWYVLKETITASASQLAQLEAILKNNYRNVQNLNGRTIYSKD